MRPSSAITLWRLESPRMSAVMPVCCLVSVFIVNHDKGSRLLLSCNSPPSSCVPPLRDSGGRFSVRLSGGVNRQQGGCHRRQGGEHGRGKGHRACRHAQRRGGMCRGGQVKPSTRLKRGHIARARLLAQESIGCRCCSCSCSCSCFCSLLLCIFSFVWPFGVGLEKKKGQGCRVFLHGPLHSHGRRRGPSPRGLLHRQAGVSSGQTSSGQTHTNTKMGVF